jgi:heme-degrading monooxygenase HmoA
MLHIIWEFHARPDRIAEFELHYGPTGSWAQLFRKASGYQETQLLRSEAEPTRFVVIDIWDRTESFIAFKANHKAEYEALDRQCEELTLVETRIGNFLKL